MTPMSRRLCTLALAILAGTTFPSIARHAHAAEPASPTPAPDASQPRLPHVEARGEKSRVQGKIVRTSRGRKGPVRLQVERADGSKVTVLVGPDELCESLGLSLRIGETVDVSGALLKTKQPILVATTFIVDGKSIRVRDEAGKLVAPGGQASPAAEAKPASVSGGDGAKPAD